METTEITEITDISDLLKSGRSNNLLDHFRIIGLG